MKLRVIRFCTLSFLVVAMMILGPRAEAAPAPDEAEMAKKAFSTLKEKLPKLADQWLKEHKLENITCEVRSARLTSAADAKLTVVFSATDRFGKEPPQVTQVLVVFLSYYDKHWTTARFEESKKDIAFEVRPGTRHIVPGPNDLQLRLLMLAIDECTEK